MPAAPPRPCRAHVRAEPVGIHHVVKGVEERPHVRVDLREHVARQEAEPLAGLDRGAGENDPADLLLGQCGDGERDREVQVGSCPPSIPNVTVESRIESTQRFCVTVFGAIFLPRRQTTSSKTSRRSSAWSSAATTAPTVSGPDLVPALHQLDELVDDRARGGDLLVLALDRQLVAAEAERAGQTRSASSTPSPTPASSAATSLGTESVSCTRSVRRELRGSWRRRWRAAPAVHVRAEVPELDRDLALGVTERQPAHEAVPVDEHDDRKALLLRAPPQLVRDPAELLPLDLGEAESGRVHPSAFVSSSWAT